MRKIDLDMLMVIETMAYEYCKQNDRPEMMYIFQLGVKQMLKELEAKEKAEIKAYWELYYSDKEFKEKQDNKKHVWSIQELFDREEAQ